MTFSPLKETFSKNRAEEFSPDVWEQFVVPLYFDELDLLTAKKPRVVIGGRGCGKTMLLRYFSHQTQFSPHRQNIPEDATKNFGLYWRIDTQFANTMRGRGITDEVWASAFDHLISLYVSLEIIAALRSLENSRFSGIKPGFIASAKTGKLLGYDENMPPFLDGLETLLERKLSELEIWVSNASKLQEPIFYPGVPFITALIRDIVSSNDLFTDTTFHVFLDEFENLTEYQQRIINTRIKHSKSPLIFSVAMKRRGFVTTRTVGTESIVEVSDYRRHDLEDYLLENDFDTFAAEVLSLNLSFVGIDKLPTTPSTLRDPELLAERQSQPYKDSIQTFAKNVLPGQQGKDLAANVFSDKRLLGKLTRAIKKSLDERGSKIAPESFLHSDFAQESIVSFALLARKSLKPETVDQQFNLEREGKDSKFPHWVHINFIGCLLWLYDDEYRECPFYSGFNSYCKLAKGNLRHFLELLYKSFTADGLLYDGVPSVDIKLQAQAARQTSIAMLREVRGFGPEGNRLHTFVLRLGSLFALAHRRMTQSEPEITHFTIKRGTTTLAPSDELLLNEAVKWSVLFEVEETKIKEPIQNHQASFEYILNPIYAPYFNISYRKQRKLELSISDFSALANGAYDDVKSLLARYSKKWSVNVDHENPTLFSHLSED